MENMKNKVMNTGKIINNPKLKQVLSVMDDKYIVITKQNDELFSLAQGYISVLINNLSEDILNSDVVKICDPIYGKHQSIVIDYPHDNKNDEMDRPTLLQVLNAMCYKFSKEYPTYVHILESTNDGTYAIYLGYADETLKVLKEDNDESLNKIVEDIYTINDHYTDDDTIYVVVDGKENNNG